MPEVKCEIPDARCHIRREMPDARCEMPDVIKERKEGHIGKTRI